MTLEFSCQAAGANCPFEVKDENADELVDIVQQHARNAHSERLSREEILRIARESGSGQR